MDLSPSVHTLMLLSQVIFLIPLSPFANMSIHVCLKLTYIIQTLQVRTVVIKTIKLQTGVVLPARQRLFLTHTKSCAS